MKYSQDTIDALLTLLEPLNEFDREESFAVEFSNTDPNDRDYFYRLVEEKYFQDNWYKSNAVKIKEFIAKKLIEALKNKDFDFKWLIEEASGTFGLPSCWIINDYRKLYEIIYCVAFSNWKEELEKVGFTMPEPKELNAVR